jgi:hypothetical protein
MMAKKKIKHPNSRTKIGTVLVAVGDPDQSGLLVGKHYLFLCAIIGMPGHCSVISSGGKIDWGYHMSNFRLATKDEI